jgi:hypothetical protein
MDIFPSTETPIQRQPENTNPLTPTNYKLMIQNLPNVTYFAQRVLLPGVNMGIALQASPFAAKLKWPGDSMEYGTLPVEFIVDENMQNWYEIYKWMQKCVAIRDFSEAENAEKVFSDIHLLVLTNKKNPNFGFEFRHAFPISLSGIQFDSAVSDVPNIICTATFAYTDYDLIGGIEEPPKEHL